MAGDQPPPPVSTKFSHPHRPPRPHRRRPPQLPLRPQPPADRPYVPPFRRARLKASHFPRKDMAPGSEPRQRDDWNRLVKTIHGDINRVSEDNISEIAKSLLRVNIFRARGILCKTLLRVQLGSPPLAPILASLISVLNTRVPAVIDLLVSRLIAQLGNAYDVQDRSLCFATAKFMAALCNHQVISDLPVFEFLRVCLLDRTDGSVELAVSMLDECAPFLSDRSPKLSEDGFDRLREVLHDGDVSTRTQEMIRRLMTRRRKNFAGQDTLDPRFDLVHEADIITHDVSLNDDTRLELQCDAFLFDKVYVENERQYEEIKRDILGVEADRSLSRPSDDNSSFTNEKGDVVEEELGKSKGVEKTTDMTDAALREFRRTVYLVLTSGITSEEWAHKLVRLMRDNQGRKRDLCEMIVEYCSREKTFSRSIGLLGERLCSLERSYVSGFEWTFAKHYAGIHRHGEREIRLMATFYGFMLASNALPWNVFGVVRLVAAETTTSSRVFLKHLFQEIYYTLSSSQMMELFKSPERAESLKGLFPSDTVANAQYAINFFANIGMGFLTRDLREWLKNNPRDSAALAHDGSDSEDGNTSESSLVSSSSSSVLTSDAEDLANDKPLASGSNSFRSHDEHPSESGPSCDGQRKRTRYEDGALEEEARKKDRFYENGSIGSGREDGEASRFRRRSPEADDSEPSWKTSAGRDREKERSARRRREREYSPDEDSYSSSRYRQRQDYKRRRAENQYDYHQYARSRSPTRYSHRRFSRERRTAEPRY
ncbi:unnamed protein product [Chondrus crispus]|uniref:MI domain-containing protein n=1 Tax=Chondrus crispus TaxID=2769 RepID=R7Q616_CHOCR|nr:unnamed protein product [Chondrus crispus]CDF33288.1 unnamed protein product [Chondrus crispus]|eukprot:XP_005713091.1 unnamed protein product [Chondrus crispus]